MVDLGAMILRSVPPESVLDQARALAPVVDELWVVEDLGWAGGVGQAAAVLAATAGAGGAGVRVGHGIAPAPLRNPALLAMEWAALARMFPGRLHAGLGHGVREWMAQVGALPSSQLRLLREVAESTRALLAGQRVTTQGDEVRLDGVALEFPPDPPPPVSLGVGGPRSLRLSGEVADGTVLAEGTDAAAVRAAREHVGAGRAAAGRTGRHRLTVFVGYYCGDPAALPPPPEHLAGGWSVVGDSPQQVAGPLRELAAAGADCLVLVPFGDDPVGQVRHAAERVRPLLA